MPTMASRHSNLRTHQHNRRHTTRPFPIAAWASIPRPRTGWLERLLSASGLSQRSRRHARRTEPKSPLPCLLHRQSRAILAARVLQARVSNTKPSSHVQLRAKDCATSVRAPLWLGQPPSGTMAFQLRYLMRRQLCKTIARTLFASPSPRRPIRRFRTNRSQQQCHTWARTCALTEACRVC